MAKKRGELEIRSVFECEEEDFERMQRWLISAMLVAARNSNHGMVAIGVYDEDGKMLGHNITGTPSAAAQEAIDAVFDSAEPVNAEAV